MAWSWKPCPRGPAKGVALMAFAVEQLLAEIENAFEARGIRIGQIASRTLYLSSYLSDDYEDSLVALVEGEDYSLLFMSEGVPVLVRYRTFPLAADDTASAEHVARDLRLIRSYLTENLPGSQVLRWACLWTARDGQRLGRAARGGFRAEGTGP